ncbi:MAG: hypothetical protein IT454_05505 [Planctomycetes bacterium]|nr:hypothetical protein [Planctomycetota bacterium]
MNLPMRSGQRFLVLSALATSAAVLTPGCNGGGDGGKGMSITSINLTDGAVWRINRPIRIEFSEPVDFSSVTLNSFNVRRVGGGPTAGEFYTEDGGRIVVFQPLCPVLADLTDAGLLAGTDNNSNPYQYELNIIGADKSSALPIRSKSGRALTLSQTRNFTTPVSTSPLNLYLDTRVGPPAANIRRVNSQGCEVLQGIPPADACNAPAGSLPLAENVLARFNPTYIERVDASTNPPTLVQHRFTLDVETNQLFLDPPLPGLLSLNLLGDPNSAVSLVIGVNQAVDPSALNINSSRVRWEFTADASAPSPTWVPLTTTVELESNCAIVGTDSSGDTVAVPGARLRLTPQGALPPGADLRALLAAEFSDIVGETNPIAVSGFAEASTEPFPTPPATLDDQYMEDFDTAANDDSGASFAEPHASWGGGALSSRFSFEGTGGPGGGFDWYIGPGEIVIFNTANSTINGYQLTFAPNTNTITQTLPIGTQTVVGGVVDVDDFYIDTGATLKVEGPNPFMLVAAGRVVIRGRVDVSGTSSAGVNTLNTTNIPEPGSPGQAGGGRGGTGSPLTTASSPKGGNGYGAFNVSDGGGEGGETGWSLLAAENKRRGAGGGGGVLGPNEFFGLAIPPSSALFEQRRIGYDAEPGFDNLLADNGAINGVNGPIGGRVAPSPFTDPNPNNNFYGTQFVYPVAPSTTPTVIVGELLQPWAGSGGGAGGDAARVTSGSFPGPWSNGGDEKGSGGGGGGGSVHVMALGPIVFGSAGQIVCRGGLGGGGENTIYLNRVGGGSGGGSGGHVVLQSSSRIDFRDKLAVNFASATDNSWAIDCRGGQGGAGSGDVGGSIQSTNGQKETLPLQDACPLGYQTTGTNPCKGLIDGAGGDGGPGLIQLHTSNGVVGPPSVTSADIVLPTTAGITLADLCAPPPLSRNNTSTTSTSRMIPTFGRTSRARSNWIALGEGGFDEATSTYRDVTFSFQGINPANGLVLADSNTGVVDPHESAMNAAAVSLLAPTANPVTATPPFVESDGFHAVVTGASLLPGFDAMLGAPALMKHWMITLTAGAQANRYDVIDATYDSLTDRIRFTVDGDGPNMAAGFGLNTTIALERAYFRVRSSGVADSLPSSATVTIQFEATGVDPITGGPSSTSIIGPTSDISNLNIPSNGYLRFVRFNVLFDIAAQGQQLSPTNPIPALEFLRLPFSY